MPFISPYRARARVRLEGIAVWKGGYAVEIGVMCVGYFQ